jgi:SSS family solute:Na+ symporter
LSPEELIEIPIDLTTMSLDMRPVDLIIFYGVCLFYILIGFSHGILNYVETRVKRTAQDFLTASSDHGGLRAALSIFANTLSAWILVRLPVGVYWTGPQVWISVVNLVLAVSFANLVVVPIFMKLQVKTALQYLEDRFGHTVLVIALVFQAIESMLFMALWLAVPIGTLSDMTNLSFTWTVIFAAVLVTLFTAVGGMRAILLIDMFHLIIISLANMIIVVKGTTIMGGFDGILAANARNGREYWIGDVDPFTRENTSWLILISYLSFGILNYSFNQSILDKYLPSSNINDARKILWLQLPLMGTFYGIAILLGLNIYAFYEGCDPFLTKRAETPEEILSTYVGDVAGHIPGVYGIFSVSLLSGALSVTAANLNGLTSIVNEHFIRRRGKLVDLLERRWHVMSWVTTAISIIFLPFVVLLVFIDKKYAGIATNPVTILNVMKTPAFGVYLLGFFNKRATSKGALIGLILGTLTGMVLVWGNLFYDFSPDPPPLGATVENCKRAFCLIKHGVNETRCQLSINEKSLSMNVSLFHPPRPSLQQQEKPTMMNYSLGGIITCIVTFITGSIASFFTHQSEKEKEKNINYLARFLHPEEQLKSK